MSDYTTLLGAEQVQSAGATMRQAAADMQRAADTLQWTNEQQRLFMDDWLQRFEAALERLASNPKASTS